MHEKPTYKELEQKVSDLEQALTEAKIEKEQIEDLLMVSNSRFRNLFKNARFGIIICRIIKDKAGNTIDFEHLEANAATQEHTGFSPEQIEGKRALEITKPEDIANIIELYGKVVDTGIPCQYDQYFAVYGRHLLVGAFLLENDLFALTFMDITERKLAEKRLKEQNYYLEKAQEIGQIGTWELDLINNILVWTDENCRIFGVPEGSVVNYETFLQKVHPDDREYVDQEWKAGTEGKPYDIEHRLLVDGEVKWVREKADLEFDDSGKALSAIGFTQDISDRKRLEKQLFQSQKLESLGSLAGGIAHEFNNILSIICGNNDFIMEDLPEGSLCRENAEEIQFATVRARDIVKQLLTFSRKDDSKKKPINIVHVVTESLKLIRSTTPANIEIKETLSQDCQPILGDSTQINQILINLCNNAVDALPASGGKIEIELSTVEIDHNSNVAVHNLSLGNYIKILVKDNGSGIDQKTLGRIFDPFFTTKGVGKGSGIGLAVVHGIVENHGGSVVCESAINQGTIFTILIPVYEDFVEKASIHTDVLSGNGEKILYIDDEDSIARLIKRLLESLGYNAMSTTEPENALKMIKAEPDRFDLVISDMAMPKMPGDQLIAEILSINPEMPTVICSGYSSRMSETKALEMGIKAFMMKPLNRAELARKIREILDNGKNPG